MLRSFIHPNMVRFIGACCELHTANSAGASSGSGPLGFSPGSLGPGALGPLGPLGPFSGGTASSLSSDLEGQPSDGSGHGLQLHLAIIMDLCKLGSLHKVITSARGVAARAAASGQPLETLLKTRSFSSMLYVNWVWRLEIAVGAAAGVQYMHANGIVHRDLTSGNLLLDWVAKPWGGGELVVKVRPQHVKHLNST